MKIGQKVCTNKGNSWVPLLKEKNNMLDVWEYKGRGDYFNTMKEQPTTSHCGDPERSSLKNRFKWYTQTVEGGRRYLFAVVGEIFIGIIK